MNFTKNLILILSLSVIGLSSFFFFGCQKNKHTDKDLSSVTLTGLVSSAQNRWILKLDKPIRIKNSEVFDVQMLSGNFFINKDWENKSISAKGIIYQGDNPPVFEIRNLDDVVGYPREMFLNATFSVNQSVTLMGVTNKQKGYWCLLLDKPINVTDSQGPNKNIFGIAMLEMFPDFEEINYKPSNAINDYDRKHLKVIGKLRDMDKGTDNTPILLQTKKLFEITNR